MNIKEIIEAWTISMKPTDKQIELAEKRSKVCEVCPEKKEIIVPVCTKCSCPISKKIFTNNENPCPLKRWGDIDKDYFKPTKVTKTLF